GRQRRFRSPPQIRKKRGAETTAGPELRLGRRRSTLQTLPADRGVNGLPPVMVQRGKLVAYGRQRAGNQRRRSGQSHSANATAGQSWANSATSGAREAPTSSAERFCPFTSKECPPPSTQTTRAS